MNPIETFKKAAPVFIAVGEEHRQQIILLLCEHSQLSVNELTQYMPLSRPAVSHHLKVLQTAGLVRVERNGTKRLYSLSVKNGIALVKQFIAALEASQKFKQGKL